MPDQKENRMIEPWLVRASVFHPRLFHGLSELPASLRAVTERAIPVGHRFLAALYVPADYRSRGAEESQETPEQALVFTDKSVVHVEGAPAGVPVPEPICIALNNVLYVKTHHVLLYGRVQLYGACQGVERWLDMQFNAIGWPLMDVEWRGTIGEVIGLPALASAEDRVVSEHETQLLETLPQKFADGLRRYGLYTGEEVISVLFQPEAWERDGDGAGQADHSGHTSGINEVLDSGPGRGTRPDPHDRAVRLDHHADTVSGVGGCADRCQR